MNPRFYYSYPNDSKVWELTDGISWAVTAHFAKGGADGVLVLMDQGGSKMEVMVDQTGTLRANANGHEPIVVVPKPVCIQQKVGNVVGTLNANSNASGRNTPIVCIPLDMRQLSRGCKPGNGLGVGEDGDPAFTTTGGGAVQAVAYRIPAFFESHGQDARYKEINISPTLSQMLGTGSGNVPLVVMSILENQRSEIRLSSMTNAVTSCGGKPGQGYQAVLVMENEQKKISAAFSENGRHNFQLTDKSNALRAGSGTLHGGGDALVGDVSPTLDCKGGSMMHGQSLLNQVEAVVKAQMKSHWEGGPHPTLGQCASGSGLPGYSNQEIFAQHGGGLVGCDVYNTQLTGDTAATVTTRTGVPANSGPKVLSPTLTASNDPSRSPQSSEVTSQVAAVNECSMQIRRLTPMECERLQGFPDNYTRIPWRKKPAENCPDAPRYKAIGNSWAVPCVRWIGNRINLALEGKLNE